MNTTPARAGDRPHAPMHFSNAVQRLLALETGTCRWPLGDPASPNFGLCGRPRAGRGSYCAEHRRLACEAGR
jgi:GcrA cell cycle regulator